MKELGLEFGDFSDHPPPPQVSLGVYEKWVTEVFVKSRKANMTLEEIKADFMKNEGRQTEEWPDFGWRGYREETDSPRT